MGLTQYVNKGHIARAALDAIAFQSRDVLDAMRQDMAESTSHSLSALKVDGGASANNLLMQIQADCIGLNVIRPSDVETTARGRTSAERRAVPTRVAPASSGLRLRRKALRMRSLRSTLRWLKRRKTIALVECGSSLTRMRCASFRPMMIRRNLD